ncbi:MAG TPA: YaiO family outer membrane beta-barrel protein [Terriglobales bacterium]|nr:YaiO family outer membrane beta-barrel protein [Terriglobales bacterium]
MNQAVLVLCALLFLFAPASAQDNTNPTVAPGSSLPGLGGVALGLNGPGYIEVGGSHSSLTGSNADWNDFYLRGTLSGGKNTLNAEIDRQARFGDSGWFGGVGLTRTLSEAWYAQFSAGGSAGGFFLMRYRLDALINRKLLSRRQLVATAGFGYDQSKTVDNDYRAQIGAAYYFAYPVVLQGGVTWTHANPGNILARTQYIAATEGYNKEHFISLRYEWGSEGYEVVGAPTPIAPAYNVLFDFPVHDLIATWRQWVGPTWGLNFNIEQHQEPAYHRLGGSVGVFLDF